jgi:hypothetical protein
MSLSVSFSQIKYKFWLTLNTTVDENNLSADDFHKLTYEPSYTYARATTSVAVVPPSELVFCNPFVLANPSSLLRRSDVRESPLASSGCTKRKPVSPSGPRQPEMEYGTRSSRACCSLLLTCDSTGSNPAPLNGMSPRTRRLRSYHRLTLCIRYRPTRLKSCIQSHHDSNTASSTTNIHIRFNLSRLLY